MSDVVIFGIGDFARTARVYLDADSDHRVVGFCVHERYIGSSELDGLPVVSFERIGESHPPDRFAMFVAVGFSRVNEARAEIYEQCKARDYELISYVNSKAIYWGELQLGDNCFVFEANVIQPNVRIGNNVILWSGNHIGHDSTIEDHCFIASHAVISGNVTIGRSSFVGVNATFRDAITVAPRCVIGAGALIMKDTQEGEVYSVRGTEALDKKSWDLNF
ncbi:MAG TPA: acetyltransferase [Actinomycetota bacterium]|jgi:sugar O-acyltransferase (sialic acid O-acetyltransferase NeuD family)|nr:acetyltransferase [Actinomycetota bacterium]